MRFRLILQQPKVNLRHLLLQNLITPLNLIHSRNTPITLQNLRITQCLNQDALPRKVINNHFKRFTLDLLIPIVQQIEQHTYILIFIVLFEAFGLRDRVE